MVWQGRLDEDCSAVRAALEWIAVGPTDSVTPRRLAPGTYALPRFRHGDRVDRTGWSPVPREQLLKLVALGAPGDQTFEHVGQIGERIAIAMQAAGKPVISIDTKKKEPIGPYKNAGSNYRPKGCPDQVKVHDFVDADLGKVVPYGVYDIAANAGCVSVGIDNDTAQFSVNSIRRWLNLMGREKYPNTDQIMITADGGGSNGSRVRLFKVELQKLADETGLTLQVCHYPPGTSKWNKIEHRLFSHITENWRGTPLTSRLAAVELIASTTTKTGLTVRCELDTRTYPKGIKVSEKEMASLNIKGDAFHPQWNYTISPRPP